ncbi:MAG: hybrid sensor histidine kinase/response regulator transcription factor [Candidatus Aminicenantes bacterium]|jgi:signal transduction histidine kinase/DNA-binding response OmpR family regulator/ligand-binding sensor domain-containing protein
MSIQAQNCRKILIIFFLLLPLILSWCTDTLYGPLSIVDEGAKYYCNYSGEYYNSQPQNWFIIQDKRGMIYSANQGAVLEYDGVSWKEIFIPGKNARSMAVDSNGTIYIGGNNEIGYLEPDDNGILHYVSLTQLLDAKYREFGYVWRSYSTESGIYFCTTKLLFLFNQDTIKVWQAETSFSPPFLVGDKLILRQQGWGLMEMRSGRFCLLPGGEAFAFESIYAIVEFSLGTLLIGTSTKGFFLYKNNSLVPFKTDALDTVSVNQLSFGLRLTDGNFALATRNGGLFIIGNQGQLKLRFDTSLGLQDNTIWHICEDSGQNLWLALNNGISKLEYRSSFSFYDERHGLKGMVFAAARFGSGGRLYAGTVSGLFFKKENGIFVPVPGISGACHALLSFGDSLLAATEKGVYRLAEPNNSPQVLSHIPAYVFQVTGRDRFPILSGTGDGLISLSLNSRTGQWHAAKFLEDISAEIRTMAWDPRGNLWIASPRKGVIKISFPSTPGDDNQTTPIVQRYGPSRFPPGVETHVFYAAGHVIIATGKGIFCWDEKIAGFVPDLTFGEEFAGGEKGKSVFFIAEDENKNVWLHSNARNLAATPQPGRTYRIYNKKFLRIPLNHVNSIYLDPLGPSVWFASVNALIRFDTRAGLEHHTPTPFRTFIRGVWANGKMIPRGNGYPEPGKNQPPELPYNRRSLRFAFAAPFFEAEENTLYQCRLDGYDREWTPWSQETRKDYTNLEPGLNVFRVRAKNVYGHISEEDVFRFKLLPPWYRTWWAYLFYILASLLMVALLVKWRSSKLMQKKQRLEAIVADRTQEINRKNEQLQEMARIKSNFFANISHEFRTPLTLIMGPLEQMIEAAADTWQQKKLKIMRRNAQRLLNLINQLLELSKFDSGSVTLKISPQDIVSFLKGLTASFELLTARNDQELTFHSTLEEMIIYFDATRMEEVFCNLLINAVKFTPAGGAITVTLDRQTREFPGFPQGYVELAVSDTGPGIPPGQMVKTFDRFYYSENIYEYNQKGAGIGLSIARELVELHHGTIAVESREGEHSGSRFTVRLPLGKDHWKPHELVETGPPPHRSADSCPTSVARMLEEEIDTGEGDAETVSEPLSGEKEIILVVEDSADVCQYIRGALEPQYKVIEARDGQEGIEKAFQVIPDLVISDIMMPRVDGYQLCKTLKQDRSSSHIPIILLTAKAAEENILEGWETGADDYITKPFSTRILCARIKNLIDIRRQMQQNHRRKMTLRPVKTNVSSLDREFFKDLHQVIESNLSDPDFNVELLANKLYMGRSTVYRKIEALCGENPTDYIRSYRLKRAAQLLRERAASVTEVAFEVGFNSRTYFTRCFKDMFQQLPSEFREKP